MDLSPEEYAFNILSILPHSPNQLQEYQAAFEMTKNSLPFPYYANNNQKRSNSEFLIDESRNLLAQYHSGLADIAVSSSGLAKDVIEGKNTFSHALGDYQDILLIPTSAFGAGFSHKKCMGLLKQFETVYLPEFSLVAKLFGEYRPVNVIFELVKQMNNVSGNARGYDAIVGGLVFVGLGFTQVAPFPLQLLLIPPLLFLAHGVNHKHDMRLVISDQAEKVDSLVDLVEGRFKPSE